MPTTVMEKHCARFKIIILSQSQLINSIIMEAKIVNVNKMQLSTQRSSVNVAPEIPFSI